MSMDISQKVYCGGGVDRSPYHPPVAVVSRWYAKEKLISKVNL